MLRSPRRALCAAAFTSLLFAACEDLPSGPQVWTRDAAGRAWVAVGEPAGLPGAQAWLAWTAPAAADSARALLAAAGRERRAGRMEMAIAAEDAAAELAAASVDRAPDPVALLSALAAVESWADRAARPAGSGRFPELQRDLGLVRQLAGATRDAMAAGDTTAAVVRMTRAAVLARRWTPVGVASRAVVEAEAAIAAEAAPSPELVRARGLLRGARAGVASGDHGRALQRAMYALQLMEAARPR